MSALAQPAPGLYGADSVGNLYSVNTSTGTGTLIGGSIGKLGSSTEIEYDDLTQTAFSQESGATYAGNSFDLTTGVPTSASVPNGVTFQGLEYVGSVLYGAGILASLGPSSLYTLDPTTGVTTLIGATGFGPISGLAYSPAGVMYGITGGCGAGGTSSLVTVNLGSGAASLVGNTGICAGSLEFGIGGTLYAGGSSGNLYTVDPLTAAPSLVGATGFAPVSGLAYVRSPTPCCNHGGALPGCIDPAIEASICAADSYCCDTAWDSYCVGEVTSIFGDNCGCWVVSTDAEGCYDALATLGLEMAVSNCVCASDAYCCTDQWDGLCVSEVVSLGCSPAPAASARSTFSIDSHGPTIGAPDAFQSAPISGGDILTTALPGASWPNPPAPGIGPLPPGIEIGDDSGGWIHLVGLLLGQGIYGCIEVDALSYGRDQITLDSVGVFSVDEFASGSVSLFPPDVASEGASGSGEASADVFHYFGPLVPTPPGFSLGNAAVVDGDGLAPSGAPGLGLVEPNPPTVSSLPDPGDNLDALDVETTYADVSGYNIYFSVDSAFPDPLEPFPLGKCGTAVAIGFSGADVLISLSGYSGPPVPTTVAIPAAALGLDLAGYDTDDLDALFWDDADGLGSLTPGDTIGFSVRRGSAVIGVPDSAFGIPIEEGDILTVPAVPGGPPAILIAAENLGLATVRSGLPNPTGYGDDVDALDVVPEPGFTLQITTGLAFLVALGRRRRGSLLRRSPTSR